MKRDRFELLSAYLDGEVTPEERRLVQTWLHNDPTAKCLYNRLMALRHGLREDACNTPCDPEVTLSGVFQCLNRRLRMVTMAGAGVAIVGVLNLLSGTMGSGPARWSVAQGPHGVPGETLHIAIDEPAFPIPAPVATPVDGRSLQTPSGLPVDSEL
ncbi:MAG: anti-sigma factor family protein [Spirulina sp.]